VRASLGGEGGGKTLAPMAKQIDLTVARRPLDRRAADMLREQILGGGFPPGHRLVEAGLAEQLGVSRGTVRAALSELAHEGLVQQIAYTKWLVPELSAHDVWELYTLRSSLEGLAAGLAAAAARRQKMTALEEAFARLEAAVAGQRRGAAAAADSALHKTIVALSGHRRLVEHYRIIEQQVQRYIASSNALLADPGDLVTQHAPLVGAVLAGKAVQAERLARAHNVSEGRIFAAHLERLAGDKVATLPAPRPGRRTARAAPPAKH